MYVRLGVWGRKGEGGEMGGSAPQGARGLEAGEVAAQQNGAAAAPPGIQNDLLAVNTQIEHLELVVQEKPPVERAGREGEIMPVNVGKPRFAREDSGKAVP